MSFRPRAELVAGATKKSWAGSARQRDSPPRREPQTRRSFLIAHLDDGAAVTPVVTPRNADLKSARLRCARRHPRPAPREPVASARRSPPWRSQPPIMRPTSSDSVTKCMTWRDDSPPTCDASLASTRARVSARLAACSARTSHASAARSARGGRRRRPRRRRPPLPPACAVSVACSRSRVSKGKRIKNQGKPLSLRAASANGAACFSGSWRNETRRSRHGRTGR